jgi:threonine dehydrogenase-like Zn-dependent dehydrogenase
MRAVVVHGADDLRIEDRPDPTPGGGEVLVAMEWGGVCFSDQHVDTSEAAHGVGDHPLAIFLAAHVTCDEGDRPAVGFDFLGERAATRLR